MGSLYSVDLSVDTLESSGSRLRRNGERYPIGRCLTHSPPSPPLPSHPPLGPLTSPKDSAKDFSLADSVRPR